MAFLFTGVTNNINEGSNLFKYPIKPWQHDCEPAWTAKQNSAITHYIIHTCAFKGSNL